MSNVTPWAFLSIFLVRIPKKEICSIFGNRDDIGHKHKKGFMDYQSIKITTKSKSISIHHGFRFDCIVMYKNDFMDNYVIKWWIVIT